MIFRCDVALADDWQSLWTHAEQTFDSQVTLLVNNAGLFSNSWQKSLDIMLYGVCHGTWLAIDKMSVAKGGKGGRIVNIASMAGFLEGTYLFMAMQVVEFSNFLSFVRGDTKLERFLPNNPHA